MTAKTVRGATTRRLSALLSLLGVAGGAAAASAPPAPDVRSPLARADGARLLQDAAEEADKWDITFLDSTTSLNGTGKDEVVLRYEIGKGKEEKRKIVPKFLAMGCEEDIAGIDVTPTTEFVEKDDDYDTLTVGYEVTPSALTGSNIWNNVTNAMEFCHVLKLELETDGALGNLEISSDTREFTVKILTTFNFTLGVDTGKEPYAIGMRILGWLNITNFNPFKEPPTDEDIDAYEKSIAWHAGNATDAMGQGQEVTSVSITNTVMDGYDAALYYELLLLEPCHMACDLLLNYTTMYENVTDHLTEVFDEENEFFSTFHAYYTNTRRRLSAPVEGSTDTDPGLLDSSFELKPPLGVHTYPDGQDFVFLIRPDDDVQIASGEADLAEFIETCRCDGAQSFACDATEAPLSPNDELSVCIRSTSADIELDALESVVLTQGVDKSLTLIENDDVLIPAITSMDYLENENGVAVITRVPSNVFTFAAQQSLTLRGVVRTKFAGSRRRALGASDGRPLHAGGGRDLQAADEVAAFTLEITLTGEESAPELATLASSATVMKKGIVAMGAVFGVVYNLLW